MAECPSKAWDRHYAAEEAAAIGKFLGDVEIHLRELDEGRNPNCWPIISFGYKDADLDPEGCTGIKELAGIDAEDRTLVVVGGHKTVSDPDEWFEFGLTPDDLDYAREAVQDYLCGCVANTVERGTDEYVVSFEETIAVAFRDDLDPDTEIGEHAKDIEKAADAACAVFRRAMRSLDEDLNGLYEEIRVKYEDKDAQS